MGQQTKKVERRRKQVADLREKCAKLRYLLAHNRVSGGSPLVRFPFSVVTPARGRTTHIDCAVMPDSCRVLLSAREPLQLLGDLDVCQRIPVLPED